MRVAVTALVLAASLGAGCTSMSPAERGAADDAKCASYGFKPRTNAFAECRQRIDLDRSADRRDRSWNDPYRRYPGRFY